MASWAIPPALADLVLLDAPARAPAVEAKLKLTHPNVVPKAKAASSASSTTIGNSASPLPAFLTSLTRLPDTKTWNGAAGFSSTENPLLDLFDGLQPGVNAAKVYQLLPPAWEYDADK